MRSLVVVVVVLVALYLMRAHHHRAMGIARPVSKGDADTQTPGQSAPGARVVPEPYNPPGFDGGGDGGRVGF